MLERLKRYGFFKYGKEIPGLMIHGLPAPYPVLNERAIRAGAGIVFVMGFFSFFQALYLGNFFFLKLLAPFLFFDFLMKVIVGIRFSPMSRLANLIVSGQVQEYVGAVQKRFAWSIGLFLSFTMLLLLYVFEVRGWPNLTVCSICLTFMFMESAFGVCVGCKIYNWLLKRGVIEMSEYKPACPGNVCAIQ